MAEETTEATVEEAASTGSGQAQGGPPEGSGPDQSEVDQEGQGSPEEMGSQHADEEDSAPDGGGEAASTSSGQAQGRVQELEEQVGRLTSRLEVQEREQAVLQEQLTSAAARYRAALLAGAPEVPEELVQGRTVEELDASLASARRIVEKVAQRLEAQVASERVPTGAPPRKAPDLSALSPREKILHALQRG
ncbi:MAG: hypothetical protein V3U26_05510 [Dehalococcoidia bacterium]